MGITRISTWTHTPLCPRIMVIPHMEMVSRKVLVVFVIIGVGLIITGVGFLSLLGFFPLFLSSQISTVKAPKAVCKQGSGSAREAKGTPTHMETAENEQDTENIPKTPPKHLRHSKPRQKDPVPNRICEGKIAPVWREQHRRESQPWQISSSLSDPSFWASRWELNKFLWT